MHMSIIRATIVAFENHPFTHTVMELFRQMQDHRLRVIQQSLNSRLQINQKHSQLPLAVFYISIQL